MSRRGGRGGGFGKGVPREVSISKALSYVLRHAAQREGVKIDSHGYANVDELLKWRKLQSLKVTLSDVLTTVETSDKKRYGLVHIPSESAEAPKEIAEADAANANDEVSTTQEQQQEEQSSSTTTPSTETSTARALAAGDPDPSNYLIRATQGHSIKTIDTSSLLQQLSLSDSSSPPLPDTVVHGTYHSAWPSIVASGGLKCMGRNQIHFATGPSLQSVLPDRSSGKVAPVSKTLGGKTVISGMRNDAQILIYINLKKAMEAGCPFWRSENDVILSEGIETTEAGNAAAPTKDKSKVVSIDFFDVVVERAQGLGVLWENGEMVQELPAELASSRNPKGRRRGGGSNTGRKGKGGPKLKVEADTDVIE